MSTRYPARGIGSLKRFIPGIDMGYCNAPLFSAAATDTTIGANYKIGPEVGVISLTHRLLYLQLIIYGSGQLTCTRFM